MKKKGLSGIITMVILIALALAVVAIVWVVINNLVKEQVTSTESCFGIFGKVKINELYTCWENDSDEFQFSIEIGDVEVDELLISVASQGATKSFRMTNEEKTIEGIKNYPSGSTGIILPGKNSGLTYIYTGLSARPDSIEIAPVIKGTQCEISDSIHSIENCY
jgi:hypothetical protein